MFPVRRTEAEIASLREFCQLWSTGTERFWAFDDVVAALSRPSCLGIYAATHEGGPWQGVLLADVGPFSADLLYVYVRPEARRAGIGRLLLRHLLTELEQRSQIEALFLEVRASNVAAQELYLQLGLTPIGKRQRYYADGEDALVMKRVFDRAEAST